jgi:hypothetical protein
MTPRLVVLLGLLTATGLPLAAQTPSFGPPRLPVCSDSATARYRARLLVRLEYDGANRGEMWDAIRWASEGHARCIVSQDEAPPPDTSVYGRLHINVLQDGGYEIATSLGGPRAPNGQCQSIRAATVRGGFPILWGVLLTLTVQRFVDCAFAARSPGEIPPP